MCMYIYICVYMYVHSSIYVFICAFICICIVHPRLLFTFFMTIECTLCDMVNIYLLYVVTLYE